MLHFLGNLLNLGCWEKTNMDCYLKVFLKDPPMLMFFSLSPIVIKLINVVKGEDHFFITFENAGFNRYLFLFGLFLTKTEDVLKHLGNVFASILKFWSVD